MNQQKNKSNSDAPITSGARQSAWVATSEALFFEPLRSDISVDVVVVGAGIAGITTAYLLCKEGMRVAVLDDGPVGGGETGRTTAHLSNALDDRYSELARLFGEENARLASASHTAAIDLIERIVSEEQIDCDFERLDGYLFLHPSDQEKSLDEELKAIHHAGLNRVEKLAAAPLSTVSGPCLKFPDQAQFHPLRYLHALAQAIVKLGGRIFTTSRASEFGDQYVKTEDGHQIRAAHIVVCTNSPVNDRVTIHTKQAPYRTFVIGVRVPKNSVPHALYWDTGDQSHFPNPYHYVRLQNVDEQFDLLIAGGEDHKTGQDSDEEGHFARLEEWTRKHFPTAGELQYSWSGQVMEPMDSLAFIGRNPGDENVYIATGDSGNGMTHGTIAGMLIRDLILGRENPWESLYDPSRRTLSASTHFLKENLNVAAQYAQYLKEEDATAVEQLPAREGFVVKRGRDSLTFYRDSSGDLHVCSAICPHMACIVEWNSAEKSFDCPCHGSRFTGKGEVINGPSSANLSPPDGDFEARGDLVTEGTEKQ